MAQGRPWTVGEEAELARMAGKMPLRAICAKLRRSPNAVTAKARELRGRGMSADLRYYEPRCVLCPSCGQMRATAAESGICEPCRLMDRVAAERASMPDGGGRELGSRVDARPPAPKLPRGASGYRKAKASDEHAMAVEAADIANLKRELRALQRRRERMEKKWSDETNHIKPGQRQKGE